MASKSESPAASSTLADIGFRTLPAEWLVIRVEELLSEDRGIAVGVMYPGESQNSGVPLLRAGDLTRNGIVTEPEFRISESKHSEYKRTALEGGELLVSLVGDVGRTVPVTDEMIGWNVARAIAVMRFKNPTDASFVRHCLMSPPFQHLMRAWSNTTVQPTLNLKEIRQIPLPWPSSDERSRISNLLQVLERRIQLLDAVSQGLEQTVRCVFESWFVNFDPVRAKAEGREPEGMDAATAALFPQAFEEGELGTMPGGWSVKSIADVCQVNQRSIGRAYPHSEIEYLDISSVEPGRIISTSPLALTEAPSRAKRLVNDGDVIWSCVRPNRRSYALVLDPAPNLVVSTGFVTITSTSMPFTFIYLQVTTDAFVDYLTMRADGAAYPAVRPETFATAKMIVPPMFITAVFHGIVAPLFRQMDAANRQARTLEELRDTLLPRLISGKVRVPEAEKIIGAVL